MASDHQMKPSKPSRDSRKSVLTQAKHPCILSQVPREDELALRAAEEGVCQKSIHSASPTAVAADDDDDDDDDAGGGGGGGDEKKEPGDCSAPDNSDKGYHTHGGDSWWIVSMMDVIPGSLPAGAMVLERLRRGGRRHGQSYEAGLLFFVGLT